MIFKRKRNIGNKVHKEYKNVVDKLFEKEKPDQILWSFFYVTN